MADEHEQDNLWASEDRLWDVNGETRVNKLCKHPERWQSPGFQACTLQEVQLLIGLVHALQPDNVLELGTHAGYAAMNIASALRDTGQGRLWTLENGDDEIIQVASQNLAGLQDWVHLIRADAKGWRPPPKTRFQLGFVDITAKDEYAQFYVNFHHYFDVGGIVVFHDTGTFWPSRLSMKKLEDLGWLRFIHLPTPRGISLGEVLQ